MTSPQMMQRWKLKTLQGQVCLNRCVTEPTRGLCRINARQLLCYQRRSGHAEGQGRFQLQLFASAGFEVIDNHGFESLDEGLVAARNAGSEIVVICSSDAEYPLLVPKLAEKTREEILVVAGNPPCRPDLEAIGVTHFIHIKTNMPEELCKYQELLFHS